MTSKTPQERLKQHKTGYVNKKGHKISANIVQKSKPMNRQQALIMEEKLGWDLRKQGYAVWFN